MFLIFSQLMWFKKKKYRESYTKNHSQLNKIMKASYFKDSTFGAPGWLSQLTIQLHLRS